MGRPISLDLPAPTADQANLYSLTQEAIEEIAAIIADAGRLPLQDGGETPLSALSRRHLPRRAQ